MSSQKSWLEKYWQAGVYLLAAGFLLTVGVKHLRQDITLEYTATFLIGACLVYAAFAIWKKA